MKTMIQMVLCMRASSVCDPDGVGISGVESVHDLVRPVPRHYSRWESADRYYLAGVERDLLGDWVVVQRWGGRHNGLGSHQVVVVADEAEGYARLATVAKTRERHGYHRVAQE